MRQTHFAWLLLLLCACAQSEGELCQEDRDCKSGLVCDRSLNSDERGTCRNPMNITPLDASVQPADGGASGEDAGQDAGPEQPPRIDAGEDGGEDMMSMPSDAAVGSEPMPDAGTQMDAG